MKIKSLLMLIATMAVAIFAMGCKQNIINEVKKPEDQKLKKLHEDPVKAEFLLQECHTHGPSTWHGNGVSDLVKIFKTTQKITYVLSKTKDKEGRDMLEWGPSADSPKHFIIRSGLDYGAPLDKPQNGGNFYSLVIKYYNAKGEDITYQFVTNGQEKIHQHFFIPVKGSVKKWDASNDESELTNLPVDENKVIDIFKYWYMDTDPHDKLMSDSQAKLIGDKDPRGFKGIFQVNSFGEVNEGDIPTTYSFDMRVKLMHSLTSKFDEKKTLSKTSTPSPYNKPTPAQVQTDVWDLDTKLHFIVYAHRSEFLNDSYASFEEVETDAEKDYIKRFAKVWNCTPEQAIKDINGLLEGETIHVSSNI